MKMFKLIIAALLLTPFAAQATLINFDATGSADVSGFVQWDDSALGGSNSNITDLSLTVLGVSFDLGNVDTGASTIISGLTIVNGAGALASDGTYTIAFFPDGFGGSTPDGDASLAFDSDGSFTFGGSGWDTFLPVKWEPTSVPEPATLALFGLGLAGLGFSRRRKRT